MKRKILLLTSIILSALPIALSAQMTYVPDDNFELELIKQGYDSGPLNDSVPTKNIDTILHFGVSTRPIFDLTGIEDFKSLVTLDCSYNSLTRLDVSACHSLTHLYCHDNKLNFLDISGNTALNTLICYYNKLQNIDVTNNPTLKMLSCLDNQLTSLDVSKCTALVELYCDNNQLSSLDVSNNISLKVLNCGSNKFTSLNIKNNTRLERLGCNYTELKELNLTNNPLLISLSIIHTQINNLDLYNNSALRSLTCWSSNLVSLDVSKNYNLQGLWCYKSKLTSLNIKNGNNFSSDKVAKINFNATNNPFLTCVQVDDSSWSANCEFWYIDSTAHYSENCNYTGVEDNKYENEAAAISPNPATDYIEFSYPPLERGEGIVNNNLSYFTLFYSNLF